MPDEGFVKVQHNFDKNMLELGELLFLTVSTILISLSFCFCFTSQTSQIGLLKNNKVEEEVTRHKRKKSDIHWKSSKSSSRRGSVSVAGCNITENQNELEMIQNRLVDTEKQLIEVKMKNLKLMKMLETAEERSKHQASQVKSFKVLKSIPLLMH